MHHPLFVRSHSAASALPRRLEAADVAWATALLLRATAAHPALRYVCGGPSAAGQYWLLKQLLLLVLRHGAAYTNAPGTALALWLGPAQAAAARTTRLRLLPATLWHLGWAGHRRLGRLLSTMTWLRRHGVAGPHHLLLGVAVLPEAQGRGEGRRLLASTLALRQTPLPCYFSTQVPAQLAFYQGMGFTLAGHCPVGDGPDGPLSNWGLLRPPTVYPNL
ncbi:GNAT family N-acetyltransferase [Hymenobacter sp. BT523]|uniref:GNAT family N-acetyltransferase n=1 Tax=Hymenobacter sp. BT523 TaxID=2795725 RepID=UPI0018EDBAC4|nr:GNAT family N-acetyltransferase [Hymenobacter sp. BT523]MBJ6111491.1 GNAT family N-acetyltransferase [Hymenobacter sp. BT523]